MAAEITKNLKLVVPGFAAQVAKSSANKQGAATGVEDRQKLPATSDSVSKIAVEKESRKEEISEDKLDQTVAEMNSFTQNLQRELNFSIDEESGQTIIKVIDTKSQEVVRQIPREEVMDVMKSLQESSALLAGVKV